MRFVKAVLAGQAIALVPYLWVLWAGHINPLRSYFPYSIFANFYDLQARALFHGHWNVPTGSLSIEAFVVHGRSYTYFGPFPALLRMPILLLTSRFDGRLTALSMLLAWFVTAFFVSLLLWRVRVLLRGSVALGMAEAVSYAIVTASVMCGTVLIYLASAPVVYNEDFAWGTALTLGSLFALLGVLERPSTRRVILLGLLVLCANLSRETLGWACVIGTLLTAAWFASGKGGDGNRRWWWPVLLAGLVPLSVGCYVTWAKFGYPFGLPMASQVWSQIDAHRQQFLAANGGKAFNIKFIPSTVLAYLRPDGLRLTDVFPFITLPDSAPQAIDGAVLDQTYRTASLIASMPLLFVLSVWGVFTAFRSRSEGLVSRLRIPMIAATAGTAGVLVWGYIAERYLTDFMPILFISSAVGLAEIWRRLDGRRRRLRAGGMALIAAGAAFGILSNLAIAGTPADGYAWIGSRIQAYVHAQETFSKYMGNPILSNVDRGTVLPAEASADRLFVLGSCSALYVSNGERFNPWIPVVFGPGLQHSFTISFHHPAGFAGDIPLLSVGRNLVSTLSLDFQGREVRLAFSDPLYPAIGDWIPLKVGHSYHITVDADMPLQHLTAAFDGQVVISSTISTDEMHVVELARPKDTTGLEPLTVSVNRTAVPALCRPLMKPGADSNRNG